MRAALRNVDADILLNSQRYGPTLIRRSTKWDHYGFGAVESRGLRDRCRYLESYHSEITSYFQCWYVRSNW